MNLRISDLTVRIQTDAGVITAVDRLSLEMSPGEALALVGESGSGKTVTAKAIMGLLPKPEARIAGGNIVFRGAEVTPALRGRKIAMIFQEPMTALNPVLTVGEQITEAAAIEKKLGRRERRELAVRSMARVQIPTPELRVDHYPHQLSGGMRQRVMIAMALALDPELLIADEPTTALDVTVQAEILALLRELRRERNMGLLLITHDLGIVSELCDRVAVIYAGQIVETGSVRDVFARPRHPYTAGLLRSVPRARGKLYAIPGVVPDLAALPSGCRFRDRCEKAEERCAREAPALERDVRCFFPEGGP